MPHNIWGNSNECPTYQRLRDNQVQSIQMVSNRIYDLQKVGRYHELQQHQIYHWMAF